MSVQTLLLLALAATSIVGVRPAAELPNQGDSVPENVLCAILHLQIPAHYWASENTFVALQKIIDGQNAAVVARANEQLSELVRARQLQNLDLLNQDVNPDEFSALNRYEVLLSLRRRELEKINRLFSNTRNPPKYQIKHSELIKKELESVSAIVQTMNEDIYSRPPKPIQTQQEDRELQQMIEIKRRNREAQALADAAKDGTKIVIGSNEHKLRNVVEMDKETLYQQKVREIRSRIEKTLNPQEKRTLRGELASLYQRYHDKEHGPPQRQGVYRALTGETPTQVAELLDIDVNKILVANVGNRPNLRPWTKLDQGTPLIIPKLLLHHAQQRLAETETAGSTRTEAQKSQSLHRSLLQAVENKNYEEAAVLAEKLHAIESENTVPKNQQKSAKKQGGGRAKDAKRQKDKSKDASRKQKKPTAKNPDSFSTARTMTMQVNCAACNSPVKLENVHRYVAMKTNITMHWLPPCLTTVCHVCEVI